MIANKTSLVCDDKFRTRMLFGQIWLKTEIILNFFITLLCNFLFIALSSKIQQKPLCCNHNTNLLATSSQHCCNVMYLINMELATKCTLRPDEYWKLMHSIPTTYDNELWTKKIFKWDQFWAWVFTIVPY